MELSIKLIFYKIFKLPNEKVNCNTDILLINCPKDLLQQSYKLGLIRMKIGVLWEHIFTLFGYEKMKKVDLINHNTKVIIELKNSHNTDNSSSRKENIKKLINSKIDGYQLVYGIINDINPRDKIICREVRYLSGACLFQFIVGDE